MSIADKTIAEPASIEAELLRQTEARGADKSICPSEVARALGGEAWRSLLGPVREAAARLAGEGRLQILRHGKPVAPERMRGVIRLRVPRPT